MRVMTVYFDAHRRIKAFIPVPIFATEKNATRLEIYADFNVAGKDASVSLRRSDGIELGPYATEPATDKAGRDYFYYDFDKTDDLAVAGPLQITVRYTDFLFDEELGEMLPVSSVPCAMLMTHVYDAVGATTVDNLAILYRKIREIQSNIDDMELTVDGSVWIGDTPPEDYSQYRVWFDISNEEIIELFMQSAGIETDTETGEEILLFTALSETEPLAIEDEEEPETLTMSDKNNEPEILIMKPGEETLIFD